MNLGELETVTTYDLPVKVLLLNNLGDGMVRQWQKLFFKGRMAATDKSLHKKDFVKAAEADGFRFAVRLDRKEDVPRVVEEFLAFDGPAFLEVMIDTEAGVYPMVGPGPGVRRDDHRRSHRLAEPACREGPGRLGDVLASSCPSLAPRDGVFTEGCRAGAGRPRRARARGPTRRA